MSAPLPVVSGEESRQPGHHRPVLEVTDLRVEFSHDEQRTVAVDGLSYSVRPGQIVAIIGESGSGKTVSSRAIMGLLPGSATVTGSVRPT